MPQGLREGSLALGASKWQTIRKNVLPYAMPGILTSSILGIARVAGETAPIMFTATIFAGATLPHGIKQSPVLSLPYHIFVLAQDSLDPKNLVALFQWRFRQERHDKLPKDRRLRWKIEDRTPWITLREA